MRLTKSGCFYLTWFARYVERAKRRARLAAKKSAEVATLERTLGESTHPEVRS